MLATSLSRLGVQRLIVVDPDTVELHNLDSMDGVIFDDLDGKKAEALARYLRTLPAAPEVEPLECTAMALPALLAVKRSDMILCCVDNPAARLAATVLATLYNRPLLDVGTGILREDPMAPNDGQSPNDRPPLHHSTTPSLPHSQTPPIFNLQSSIFNRLMGADIRLTLPGERCLLCLGGIGDLREALDQLTGSGRPVGVTPSGVSGGHPLKRGTTNGERHDWRTTNEEWRSERAGSLRSLNGIAVHLGLRLIEDLAASRLEGSTWLRLHYGPHGVPEIEQGRPSPQRNCPLCELAGLADAGLPAWPGALRSSVR